MTAVVGDAAAPDAAEDVGERRAGSADTRRARRLLAAVLVAVNLPIVVATVRALARGWQPMGDNGVLVVRAGDVGTAHNPMLGSWTSASLVLDTNVNNPGPLYFDLIAPAVKVLGSSVGLAVGVMLVNVAAASLAVVVARRLGGTETMVAVGIAAAGLQWAMGSELLFDVWQPNALVLPFFAFLVVISALANGDLVMAPWAVGLGSLVVQTHMSHAVLVAVLSAAAAALCVWSCRRQRDAVRWRRPLLWTAAVALAAWIQPFVEQFTGPGQGNLSRIASAAGQDTATFGWSTATRMVAEVVALSPWFGRDSYASAIPSSGPDHAITGIVSPAGAAVVVIGLLVGMAAGTRWALRSERRGLAAMTTMAGLALVTAVVGLATSPVSLFGASLHQMRWLWPIAGLLTAAGVAVLLSLLHGRPRVHRPLVIAAVGVAVLVAVANLPTHVSGSTGPIDRIDELAAGRELVGQLGALEGRGPVLYDPSTLYFGEPYSGMTFAELEDRGISFVFADEVSVRQFGEGRRDDGTATLRLWQEQGSAARDVPPGAERVAFVEGPEGPVALFVEPIG